MNNHNLSDDSLLSALAKSSSENTSTTYFKNIPKILATTSSRFTERMTILHGQKKHLSSRKHFVKKFGEFVWATWDIFSQHVIKKRSGVVQAYWRVDHQDFFKMENVKNNTKKAWLS